MDSDTFSYDQFIISDDRSTVSFDYTIRHDVETYHLSETLEFPARLKDTPEQLRGLRALHLALGVSYYKIFVPPQIIQPYAMDETEAGFWNDIWKNGLGEFLYVNKLSADTLAKFTAQDGTVFEGVSESAVNKGALLGIGGGKDSIVAGELLKTLDMPVTGFVMATGGQLGQAGQVVSTMGIELEPVKRQLDRQLLDLQEQPGAYKGHVPISLIFGLVGTVLATATDSAYVVVANEAAASIPRATWQGQAVNHQWSKSFGFERQLQDFVHTSIDRNVTYFSAIRQLTSIGVAKLFAGLPQYFEVFTSDNFVFRIDPARRPSGRWSLESPKSLSSYILLAPWLSDEDLKRTFTLDFLDETSLQNLFMELTGVEGEPPLDCVGTVEELVLSLNLLAEQGRLQDTALMRLAHDKGLIRDAAWQAELAASLEQQNEQALPEELSIKIHDFLQERLAA